MDYYQDKKEIARRMKVFLEKDDPLKCWNDFTTDILMQYGVGDKALEKVLKTLSNNTLRVEDGGLVKC